MAPTPTGQRACGGQPWPLVNYGPGAGAAGVTDVATAVGKGGKAIGGIIAAIILVAVIVPIVGAVIAFFAARDSFPEFGGVGPTDDTTYLPGQAPGESGVNVHTVEGYTELVDALRDETDATYAFTAVLYPRYAVIQVPTGTNNRYQSFYWNGEELELQDIKGTTDDAQVDLSLVDPQLMIDMLNTVRGRLDNPENWYVIIGDSFGSGPQISCLRVQRLQRVAPSSPRPSTAPSSTRLREPPAGVLAGMAARPPRRGDGRVRLRQVDRRCGAGGAARAALPRCRLAAPGVEHREDGPR